MLNKIIKSKKMSGFFKRKMNVRVSLLRKRSLYLTRFIFMKNQKKPIRPYVRWKRKKWNNYRVYNLDFYKQKNRFVFENRKILRLLIKKRSLRKQNKLTSYLINILNKNSKKVLNMYEYKLWVILIKSNLFNNLKDIFFFLRRGFISVNNVVVYKSSLLIKVNDCIKINNKKLYYKFYKNKLTNTIFDSKKINWAFYKFKKRVKFKKKKYFSKVYKWIISNVYFGFDIPYNLEVDFSNLTVFILMKSFDISNSNYVTLKFLNLYLIRLYNWNYVT